MASYRVALLGEGVRPSLTPPMHRTEAAALGIPYQYEIRDLRELHRDADDVAALLDEAENDGFDALNVTHPLKQRVIPFLDELSPEAETIGAVNLVLFSDGRRIGRNTDVAGFSDALADGLSDASLDHVVQIGAGGAGSATAYALLSAGVKRLSVADSDSGRADHLVVRYRRIFPDREVETIGLGDTEPLRRAAGLLNATPVGMFFHPGMPVDVSKLPGGAWVADVVYRPVETQLIREAEARGLRTLDGGRMAVGQAAASIRLITGFQPDRRRMRRHFLELLSNEETPQATA